MYMDKNLTSYCKVYHDWLDASVCEQTIKELKVSEESSWSQHEFYNVKEDASAPISGNQELDISFMPVSTRGTLMQRVWDGFLKYNIDLDMGWQKGWQGFTPIRFNRYHETRIMAEHCDHIHSIFEGEKKGIPILSFVGVLNDDYEGGEFVMWEDQIIELKRGSVMIFPSVFLYPHRVDPVTSGTRYSFVSWAW